MQFSVLTLKALEVVARLSEKSFQTSIPWEVARKEIVKEGFSAKQADGELDRFCYGFVCQEQRNKGGVRVITLTPLGKHFINSLIQEAPYQSSQIAFLLRPAKKKESWNLVVQESTFFNPRVYEIIKEYKLRPGGSRDFLRSITTRDLMEMLEKIFSVLSPSPTEATISLDECIKKVKREGKYWSAVGSQYSQ